MDNMNSYFPNTQSNIEKYDRGAAPEHYREKTTVPTYGRPANEDELKTNIRERILWSAEREFRERSPIHRMSRKLKTLLPSDDYPSTSKNRYRENSPNDHSRRRKYKHKDKRSYRDLPNDIDIPKEKRYRSPSDYTKDKMIHQKECPSVSNSISQTVLAAVGDGSSVKEASTIAEIVTTVLNTLGVTQNSNIAFPSNINDLVGEFDPANKNLTVDEWLCKVDEVSNHYHWDDMTTIKLAVSKLKGHAKHWYDGLKTVDYSWSEWKSLLKRMFPSNIKFGLLLNAASNYNSSQANTLSHYAYVKLEKFSKLNLHATEAQLVDYVIHGVDDSEIREIARLKDFPNTFQLIEYFKMLDENKPKEEDYKLQPCEICRRTNHSTEECRFISKYSSNDISSVSNIPPLLPANHEIKCSICKRTNHTTDECKFRSKYGSSSGNLNTSSSKRNSHSEIQCNACGRTNHITEECRLKKKLHCVYCQKPGHVAEVCRKRKANISKHLNDTNSKQAYVNGKRVEACLDSGSSCTLIRQGLCRDLRLSTSPLHVPFQLSGIGNIHHVATMTTRAELSLGGSSAEIDMIVVPDHIMEYDLLVGNIFSDMPNDN